MHAVGLHSALAIKRQRKRRDEQKRAKERRYSTQSTESGFTSPHNSMGSLDRHHHRRGRRSGGVKSGEDVGSKVVTSIGMLHIGVVFLVLGAFLLVSGLLPGDISSWSSMSSAGWLNELVITGAFAFALGLFLIILNRIISKKEEDDLNEYVQSQLTRSKSGHRLVRDVETGCLTTKHQQRAKLDGGDEEAEPIAIHSPSLKSPPPAYSASHQHTLMMMAMEGEQPGLPLTLEQIEEESEKGEEESRAMDSYNKEAFSNGSTTGGSLSPNSPDETQVLLAGQAQYLNTSKI
ncbi:uncharacterized protein [Anabrus simplex]|uniref:uncharacterized protein n=1 Tax=Anabrus simplex TaxID=316456 RepID=UPI0034DD0914